MSDTDELEAGWATAKTLAEALPFIQLYDRETVVIKYGGHAMGEESVAKLSGMTKFELAYIISDSSLLLKPWKRTTQLGASALHPSRRRVNERLVKKASDAGIKVRPWVVNNPKRVKEMLELGVDAIFTDRPEVARAVRRKFAG